LGVIKKRRKDSIAGERNGATGDDIFHKRERRAKREVSGEIIQEREKLNGADSPPAFANAVGKEVKQKKCPRRGAVDSYYINLKKESMRGGDPNRKSGRLVRGGAGKLILAAPGARKGSQLQ